MRNIERIGTSIVRFDIRPDIDPDVQIRRITRATDQACPEARSIGVQRVDGDRYQLKVRRAQLTDKAISQIAETANTGDQQ